MRRLALVTGGAGFIGSHLVDRLINDGWDVRVIDNFSTGRRENISQHNNSEKIEVVKGDLKSLKDCLRVVDEVEVIFHFAANPEVRVSTTHPKIHFDDNVVATFNLLEAIRQKDSVKSFVFASSSSVYGEPENIPVNECAPIRPVSVYGASKAACENLIHAYCRLYGIRSVILRYANIVGPRLRHGVVYDFIQKLRITPQKLEILGDGLQIRSYLYVNDAIEATLIAYDKSVRDFEVYNIGNKDWITVKDVASIVSSELGLDKPKYVFKPVLHGVGWRGDVKKISLCIDKIKSKGWQPTLNSRAAVMLTVRKLKEEI